MRRTITSAAIVASVGLLAACGPPAGPPAPPTAPEISGFAAVSHRTVAPAPVAVTFRVSDVNGEPITCVLDDGPSGRTPAYHPEL